MPVIDLLSKKKLEVAPAHHYLKVNFPECDKTVLEYIAVEGFTPPSLPEMINVLELAAYKLRKVWEEEVYQEQAVDEPTYPLPETYFVSEDENGE